MRAKILPSCVKCHRPVMSARHCYVTPMCTICLPLPAQLPVRKVKS